LDLKRSMYYIYVTSNVGFNPPHFLRY